MNPSLPPSSEPIVLFDGICNLCNSAVRWLVERDAKGQFRFASLQSDAARAAVAAAGKTLESLPDSIVLLDAGGVHTRSDAAIRIARRLGFPWALLSLAAVLPRFVRDGVYSWIARNRYRWFGRQNACMVPTPALRGRFLDADEPLRVVSPTTDAADEVRPSFPPIDAPWRAKTSLGGVLSSGLHRFVLVYLFIYIFPFPFDALTGMASEGFRLVGAEKTAEVVLKGPSELLQKYEEGKRYVVTQAAQRLFRKEITVFPAGSGDTTYNYIELLVYAATALLLAGSWSLLALGRGVSLRVADLMNVFVRYNLAATMLGYGWHKVWPVQMPPPGPDRFIGSIGDMSPMGILWTLMGTSSAYQIFGGLGEVTGGLLLLFRRTALLGALVTAGVMANVVALNYCFDVPVKLYSSHLLLQAIFLIAPHAGRLAALLFVNLPAQPAVLRPFPVRSWALWTPLQLLKLTVFAWMAVKPGFDNYPMMKQYGPWAEKKPWEGVYTVESFVRDGVADRALEDADRWVRVGITGYGAGAIQRANGRSLRHGFNFDEKAGTVAIMTRGSPQPSTMQYKLAEPGLIELEGTMDSVKVSARLRRDDEYKPLLMTRGFHWINEFPLNR